MGNPAIDQTMAVKLQKMQGNTTARVTFASLVWGFSRIISKSSNSPMAKPRKGLNIPGVLPQIVVGTVSKPKMRKYRTKMFLRVIAHVV